MKTEKKRKLDESSPPAGETSPESRAVSGNVRRSTRLTTAAESNVKSSGKIVNKGETKITASDSGENCRRSKRLNPAEDWSGKAVNKDESEGNFVSSSGKIVNKDEVRVNLGITESEMRRITRLKTAELNQNSSGKMVNYDEKKGNCESCSGKMLNKDEKKGDLESSSGKMVNKDEKKGNSESSSCKMVNKDEMSPCKGGGAEAGGGGNCRRSTRLKLEDSSGNVVNKDNVGSTLCVDEVKEEPRITRSKNRALEKNVESLEAVNGNASACEVKKESAKKHVMKRPTTVKELLMTGLLEGYPVFYNPGMKGIRLRGIIIGIGILCSCELCKGTKVVSPSNFEFHACKVHRHAQAYICLENGKSLRDAVNDCRRGSLKTVEETIKSIIGPAPVKKRLSCRNCKVSFVAILAGKGEQLCDSCICSSSSEHTPTQPINTKNGLSESLSKRYFKCCKKKTVLPPTDVDQKTLHKRIKTRSEGFQDIDVAPIIKQVEEESDISVQPVISTRHDSEQSKLKNYPDVPSCSPPSLCGPKGNKPMFLDASRTMANGTEPCGSVEKDAANERSDKSDDNAKESGSNHVALPCPDSHSPEMLATLQKCTSFTKPDKHPATTFLNNLSNRGVAHFPDEKRTAEITSSIENKYPSIVKVESRLDRLENVFAFLKRRKILV